VLDSDRKRGAARRWWLTPAILATQEAEIRRITVRSQPRQIVYKTLSWKYLTHKKGWRSGSSVLRLKAVSSNPSTAK
jgi:hypothetical protein